MILQVLLAVRPAALRQRFERLLAPHDVLLSTPATKADIRHCLRQQNFDLVVLQRDALSGPLEKRLAAGQEQPDCPGIIALVEREDAEERARLLALGCLAVLYQGLPDAILEKTLARLLQRHREKVESRNNTSQHEPVSGLADFVSCSPVMRDFVQMVRRVVASDSSLLILGETGVGKETLAHAIHRESLRRQGPFIAVNCGALPEGLLESELFGHEEGAFTGATRARRGHFELAHRGTIFLDEIGEMTPALQVKLLRVLQNRTVQRVGSEKPIPLDVRVMAATNRDLMAAMQTGLFRPDLYYRLAVVTLNIPPLRERPEDIPTLVENYVQFFRQRLGRPVTGVTPEALRALVAYPWPGNVRELINVIERALLLCTGPRLTLADLPNTVAEPGRPRETVSDPARDDAAVPGLDERWLELTWEEARAEALAAVEKAYLSGLLQVTGGRIGTAARRAGLNPRSLYDKLKRHGLRKEDFR